ncbi:MAG: Peptidase [Candidatus Saccharibacteria bacterium]|nr:Peptidase [Candidatus Saccharibacteria bacterium]
MAKFTVKKIGERVALVASLLVLLSSSMLSGPVSALSAAQKKAFDQGIDYYDTEDNTGCTTDESAVAGTLPPSVPAVYADIFTKAAAQYHTNPQFIAALFMSEHSNVWVPADTKWASSPVGASGPFQFMPGTWSGYKVDGNNDGVVDIQNLYDATYAVANMLARNGMTTTSPLGTLETPFKPGTFVFFSATYNWGGGNVGSKTTPSSPLSAAPAETENYMTNIYTLISSGFTKGSPKNGDPVDQTGGKTAVGGTAAGVSAAGTGCSSGVVAGNIVETALNLAWDTPGHGPLESDAKPTYQKAMPQYNGTTGATPFSDCGIFVATVMIASGADPNYPKVYTPTQMAYLASSPNYTEIKIPPDAKNVNTGDLGLQPGDIFINSVHTYIFVGPQSKGFSIVSASLGQRVPEAGNGVYFYQDGNTGEQFRIFRLLKTEED